MAKNVENAKIPKIAQNYKMTKTFENIPKLKFLKFLKSIKNTKHWFIDQKWPKLAKIPESCWNPKKKGKKKSQNRKMLASENSIKMPKSTLLN